jgi:hypothetical protein
VNRRDEQSHRGEAVTSGASQIFIADHPKTSAVEAVEITADHNFGEAQQDRRRTLKFEGTTACKHNGKDSIKQRCGVSKEILSR